jgi:hypothetical protein
LLLTVIIFLGFSALEGILFVPDHPCALDRWRRPNTVQYSTARNGPVVAGGAQAFLRQLNITTMTDSTNSNQPRLSRIHHHHHHRHRHHHHHHTTIASSLQPSINHDSRSSVPAPNSRRG